MNSFFISSFLLSKGSREGKMHHGQLSFRVGISVTFFWNACNHTRACRARDSPCLVLVPYLSNTSTTQFSFICIAFYFQNSDTERIIIVTCVDVFYNTHSIVHKRLGAVVKPSLGTNRSFSFIHTTLLRFYYMYRYRSRT